MTLKELQDNWQDYALFVDVTVENRRIIAFLILRKRFFVCFLNEEKDGLVFDPGGHDPRCFTYRVDEADNCYLKMPNGAWLKIGKFIKIDEEGRPIE